MKWSGYTSIFSQHHPPVVGNTHVADLVIAIRGIVVKLAGTRQTDVFDGGRTQGDFTMWRVEERFGDLEF